MSENQAPVAECTTADDARRKTAIVQLWNASKAPLCPGLNHITRKQAMPKPGPMTLTSPGYSWSPKWLDSLPEPIL